MALTSEEAFSFLRLAHAEGRLAHAYLITGQPGSGTRELATKLTGLILGVDDAPLSHRDAYVLEAESKSRRIKVDAVRELDRALQLRSFSGGPKVGIIFDADRLMESAANAFLKTLEEPPTGSHLLLVSSQGDQLLETVISRCVEVPLRVGTKPELCSEERELLKTLSSIEEEGNLASAFLLVQQFSRLCGEAKSRIQEEADEELKKEEIAYKKVGDTRGLDEREEHYKALVEARYRSARASLVAVLEQWFADALRQQHGAAGLDFPEHAAATRALGSRATTGRLLRSASALEGLRENFNRNVQEQLALECAILTAFAG